MSRKQETLKNQKKIKEGYEEGYDNAPNTRPADEQGIQYIPYTKYDEAHQFFELSNDNDFDRTRTFMYNDKKVWVGEILNDKGEYEIWAEFVFTGGDETGPGVGRHWDGRPTRWNF